MNSTPPAVVSFEATDYTSIQRLDPWCEIWSKVDHLYVFWFIVNVVAREIVEEETDMVVLLLHLLVKVTDPSVEGLCHCLQNQKVRCPYSSNNTAVIHAFLLFL